VGLGHDSCVDKQLNDWKMFGRKFKEAQKTGYVTAVIVATPPLLLYIALHIYIEKFG
jgi:hypothetical protein